MGGNSPQPAPTHLAPQLDCRASLWNLLRSRQDIDSVTLELLGRHFADQSRLGSADRNAFILACQLEMVFGLQRTHLQSRPPYGACDQQSDLALRSIIGRSPYILSLKTAKDAFACLSKQAMDYLEMCSGKQDERTSLRRMVIVRTLVSGVRMLCLHPNIVSRHASLSSLSLRIGSYFGLWERILCQTCNFALRQEPRKHQVLNLQVIGLDGNMLPLGDSRLLHVANGYIDNFFSDPHSKYWALYDLSWNIVAAFIQCQAVRADLNAREFFSLATEIASGVMAEACKEPEDAETCALLLDVVELLHPVLIAGAGKTDGTWQASYDKILAEVFPGRTSLFKVHHACVSEEVIALRGFEYDLKQRQLVIRNSNGELPTLLSRLEEVCLAAVSTYNGCPSSATPSMQANGPKAALKLYLLNCGVGHIITETHEYMVRLLNDESHRISQGNECLIVSGGDQCPFCVSNADPHSTFTRLKEVLPLNNMLEVITQTRQELGARGNRRLRACSPTEGPIPTNTTEEHKDSRCGDLLYPSPHASPALECPFCMSNADPHSTFTRLKEVLPLNNMLEVITQTRQELGARGNQRLRACSPTERPIPTNTTEEHKDSRCGDLLYPSPHASPALESGLIPVSPKDSSSSSSIGSSVGFGQASKPGHGLQVASPLSPLKHANGSRIFSVVKKFGFPRKISATESFVELPAGEVNSFDLAISLEQLGPGKKNVTLSPDFKRIIFWTKKSLAVLNRSDMEMAPIEIESADLVIASKGYCAIVRRYIDRDERAGEQIRWYSFDQGFDSSIHSVSFKQNGTPDVVQCLAITPDDTHLAVGLKGGSVMIYDLQKPGKSQALNFGVQDGNIPTVASLSFSADAGELVVSIRTGSTVYVYHCLEPFTNPILSFTHDIGSHERDNQGVSSAIRSSDRDLFCITSWTLHGIPLLRDGATCKTKPLEKSELAGLGDMSNRIQQATFSKSGQILVLVDAAGGIFKISTDNIEKVRAERVASSLRLRWKSQSIKSQQLLDIQIADDERRFCVVWIDEKRNQAQVVTLPTGAGD